MGCSQAFVTLALPLLAMNRITDSRAEQKTLAAIDRQGLS